MAGPPSNRPLVTVKTPGEILFYDWMEPSKISQYRLSKDSGIDISTINLILKNKSKITPRVALAFSKFFGTDKFYWIGLQNKYDFWKLEKEK